VSDKPLKKGSAEENVLREAAKWFRAMLRKDALESHEQGLFDAMANLRAAQQAARPLPKPPPLPAIKGSYPETLKDFPAMREEKDPLTVTTRPAPQEMMDDLLEASKGKK
jgi:hypothetical protein